MDLKIVFSVAKDLQFKYHMNWTQILGITAGLLTATSMLPQLIKTLKEKKAEDVSLKMLVVLLLGITLWIAYGFLREDLPIIVTNSFSFLLNITMIYLRKKYKHGDPAADKG
jgi:MtN3 and saliva related transmembrane protein